MESALYNAQREVLEEKTCYHCGEKIQDELLIIDELPFCCQGCSTVYDILKENELCNYYNIEGAQGNSPAENFFKGKFDHLDLPEVESKLIDFTDGRYSRVNWHIPKIHCSSCIWLLEQLHRLNPAIITSLVNFPEKQVAITFRSKDIKLSELAELITRIGYEPYLSLNDIDGKKKGNINRLRLYKIGIAGFAFGNIMMMSFPEYFHIQNTGNDLGLSRMFSILNIVLSIPVLFFCASDFFKSAWTALKARYLNIDAPIALALLCVFLTSLYQIATETGPGYFDSLTGAVFFMLLGRYFQDKTYQGISFERDYKSYFPVAISVVRGQKDTRVPIVNLEKGDQMFVRNEELIPADSVLVSPTALIDYSFVSGEAAPVLRRKGDTIYAGGKQKGAAINLEVLRPVSQAYLTQLWNNDIFTQQKENQQHTLATRINKYFSAVVLSIAFLTFLFWFFVEKRHATAFNAFTTILLVACPCALLLSSTFTNGNLLSLFGKHKFYPKNAHALEMLSAIDTIVFDKTGTITVANEGQIKFVGRRLTDDEEMMVKTIAHQSAHPLSRMLAENLNGPISKRSLIDFEEIAGAGMQCMWGNKVIKLGSAKWTGADATEESKKHSTVFLSIDGTCVGYFIFNNKYRPELPETIEQLANSGYTTYLLSGDKPTDENYLGTIFKGKSNLFFNQTPDGKLNFVRNLQTQNSNVLMVGDGLNDAGALRQSNVGLAVSDDINNFSPSCDAIVQSSQLAKLPEYIKLAKKGQQIIKISFSISLLYNLVGLSFAVAGELTPVVAAILMPISSISIVLFTTLATNIAAKRLFSN